MPKARKPTIARLITGTIHNVLTFSGLSSLQIVKRKPTPGYTRTPAQDTQRLKYANCLQQWQELDPDQKQAYITQAKGYPQTALSLFMSACLMAPPSAGTLSGTVTLLHAHEDYAVCRFFTPGTTTELLKRGAVVYHDGTFTITGITPGTYDIGITLASSLSKLKANITFTAGETTAVDFGAPLWPELNRDDWIAVYEYNVTLNNYGKKGDCKTYPGNWLL